jgi:hypothetical protein
VAIGTKQRQQGSAQSDDSQSAAALSRLAKFEWASAECGLDERGYARLPKLLGARECASLVRSFGDETLFRSTIDMARYRFGEGHYRYFQNPLPALVGALRRHLYPPLAVIANRWEERLGTDTRYPPQLDGFLRHCERAGQTRPTPLMLHYREGGYNCLHQDRYGEVAFPLQVVILLSCPKRDFQGGELLITEQRPRMQSRGEAISLLRGEALVFPNQTRPVQGARGTYRASLRHGLSRLHAGERYALGIIFHDAE